MPPATRDPEPPAPAWTGADLAGDPHATDDKPERVRRMFASIAPRYDLNNRLHSFGRDRAWRRSAVRAAGVRPGERALDVACGTGDLTRLLARAGAGRVVGADFCDEMLARARAKPPIAESAPIEYVRADAMDLPFEDAAFDVVTIAFGLRNVADPARAVNEFHRVLRPGGRLVILEFDRPASPVLAWLNDLYCRRIMPITATLISRDRSGAYRYLPRSVETFLDRQAIAQLLRDGGFTEIEQRPLTFGVCVCHRGVRV